jgi:hypothetical protein
MRFQVLLQREEVIPGLRNRRLKAVTVLIPLSIRERYLSALDLDDDKAVVRKRDKVSLPDTVITMSSQPQ